MSRTPDKEVLDGAGRPLFVDGTYPRGRPACASVFEELVATTNAADFFGTLDGRMLWDGPWADETEAMPRDVRMLRLVAHMQWLIDFNAAGWADSDWLAAYGADLARWLDERGAADAARHTRELLALYPDGVPMAKEPARERHIAKLEKKNPALWDDMSRRYPLLETELADRLREWLRQEGARVADELDAIRRRFAEPMPASPAKARTRRPRGAP